MAAIIAPPPPDGYELGDAIWVKIYKTEAPERADLDHLLTDDPAVPQTVDLKFASSATPAALIRCRTGRTARCDN